MAGAVVVIVVAAGDVTVGDVAAGSAAAVAVCRGRWGLFDRDSSRTTRLTGLLSFPRAEGHHHLDPAGQEMGAASDSRWRPAFSGRLRSSICRRVLRGWRKTDRFAEFRVAVKGRLCGGHPVPGLSLSHERKERPLQNGLLPLIGKGKTEISIAAADADMGCGQAFQTFSEGGTACLFFRLSPASWYGEIPAQKFQDIPEIKFFPSQRNTGYRRRRPPSGQNRSDFRPGERSGPAHGGFRPTAISMS